VSHKWGKTVPKRKPVKARRDTPKEFRVSSGASCAIKAAEGADGSKLATFDGVAYTGAPMRPMGWWNDVIIDLAGVQIPSQHRPALRQHDHEQIVGHTTSIKADKNGIPVEGVFSGEQQHVDTVTVPAKNGFQWQLSLGADPIRTEFLEAGEETEVNGRKVVGPMTISRETRIGEISFVPLGADGDTSVTVAAQKGSTMNPFALALKQLMAELRTAGNVEAAKYSDADVDAMTAEEAKAALKECMSASAEDDDEDDDDEDEEDEDKEKKSKSGKHPKLTARQIARDVVAETRKATAIEMRRQSEITAAVRKHNVTDIDLDGKKINLAAHAIGEGWSAEKAELHALRAARPNGPVGVPGGLGYVASQPEMGEAVLEAAVFHAARHQMRLQDDDWYLDTAPDGKTKIRRVPIHLQREAQSGFAARYTDKVQQAAHDMFVNARSSAYIGQFGLQQFFRTAMRAKGVTEEFDYRSELSCERMLATWAHAEPKYAATNAQPIRAEGASNLSIGNVLANVLNKFALQGYLYVEQVWRKFCAIRSVTDFKPSKSINLLGDVMFKQLGPSGELSNATIGDQAFANQAQMFGRILTAPIMHIMNDDLGILTGLPSKIGQGAGLALNDNVWTLMKNLITSLNGDDGNAFFRTTSSVTAAAMKAGTAYKPNKTTGALAAGTLQTAKALLDNQIDPNGNPLGLTGVKPVMLFGPSQWQTVMGLLQAPAIVYGGASAALQPDKNMFAGYAEPAMSAYIENANYVNSTTAYFLILEALWTGIIEVCFLNGVDTPAVLQAGPDFQFDRPGISIRGTMPFGSNQQNFRCGVYSTGA
jgi:Caudovirus prohead serine protease